MSTVTEDNRRKSYLKYGYIFFNESLNNDIIRIRIIRVVLDER